MNGIDDSSTNAPARQGPAKSGPRQKLFNTIGWLSFALLIPPALAMFGLPQFQAAIVSRLGAWGSPIALVAYFYVILFLRVFFGSDQRYTPVLLGYAVSFIYFSNSLDIGFMAWLRELSARVPLLASPFMTFASFAAGIAVIFLANALSGAKKANWILDAIVLVALPAGALVAAAVYLPRLLGF